MLDLQEMRMCLGDGNNSADIKQIGIVVRDMDRAMNYMKTIFGLEPVGEGETPNYGEKTYAGEPEDFCAKMVFYRFGDMDVELILPLRGRSVWSDFLNARGEGLHHIQLWVKNFEKTKMYLENLGMPMMQGGESVRYPGAKFGYFDCMEQLGYYLEVFNPEECGYCC